MSERVELERRSDIRKGDLVRIEFGESSESGVVGRIVAVEYVARRDGYVWPTYNRTFTANAEPGRRVFLLDRPVVLPTRPYSLVVPPPEQAQNNSAFILEPMREGAEWMCGQSFVAESEVEAALKRGWRIIEGPEETTNGDAE